MALLDHYLNFEPDLCARNSVSVSQKIQHKGYCANSRTIRCDDVSLHELKNRFQQFNFSNAYKGTTEGRTGTTFGLTAIQISFSSW